MLCDVAHVGKKNKAGNFRKRALAHGVASLNGPLPLPLLVLSSFSPKPPENMRAVRRGDRRAERNQQSLPYRRPNAQSGQSVRASHVLHLFLLASPSSRLNHTSVVLVVVIIGFLQLLEPLA